MRCSRCKYQHKSIVSDDDTCVYSIVIINNKYNHKRREINETNLEKNIWEKALNKQFDRKTTQSLWSEWITNKNELFDSKQNREQNMYTNALFSSFVCYFLFSCILWKSTESGNVSNNVIFRIVFYIDHYTQKQIQFKQ